MKRFIPYIRVEFSKEFWYMKFPEETYFNLLAFQIRVSKTGGANGFHFTLLGLNAILTSDWLSDWLGNKLKGADND